MARRLNKALSQGLTGDAVYVSFCMPCAISQEARQLEKAAQAPHSHFFRFQRQTNWFEAVVAGRRSMLRL